MIQPGGPQVAAVSIDGFDTHANQGSSQGQLATRLAYLDAALDGLAEGMGPAWKDTAVVVVTEFGRTAQINGTAGTDHGTASTALLLGGALKQGGIVGDWPTLAQGKLFEDRDTAPTSTCAACSRACWSPSTASIAARWTPWCSRTARRWRRRWG